MTTIAPSITEEIHAGEGFTMVMQDGMCLAANGSYDQARAAEYLRLAGDVRGKSIAWIGGGMCNGPRLFAPEGCKQQAVFEIEPAFALYCPMAVIFVPGDWHDTLAASAATFDIIIYDIGNPAPTTELSKHLAFNGVILSLE